MLTQRTDPADQSAFRCVGIIGVGTTGRMFARACVVAGLEVLLLDRTPEKTKAGLRSVQERLRLDRQTDCLDSVTSAAAESRLHIAGSYAEMAGCDFVLEALPEREELKIEVLRAVCPHLRNDIILGTSTSSLSITRLAHATDRSGRFLGFHIPRPEVTPTLAELVRGMGTEDDVITSAAALGKQLGMVTVISEDAPGFVLNRILMPMINEAVYVFHERVAKVDSIDLAMELGANHALGPMRLADQIGLDHCYEMIEALRSTLSDEKYRPCPLLAKYVDAGWLGKKSQRGFYDYRGDKITPSR